jgi:hypothetical protein
MTCIFNNIAPTVTVEVVSCNVLFLWNCCFAHAMEYIKLGCICLKCLIVTYETEVEIEDFRVVTTEWALVFFMAVTEDYCPIESYICSLADSCQHFGCIYSVFYSVHRGSRFLWNMGTNLPNYILLQSGR